jgi:cell division protein FtsZ
MAIDFHIHDAQPAIIKVIGVGGGGGNAVNNMFHQGIEGVDFVVCNTDLNALRNSPIPQKLALGMHVTEGLGCGGKPEVGQKSAIESVEEIRQMLSQNTKMVFVTATMGGGTGTGAAPVIAAMAREMGILTIGIVTKPFEFEAEWRMENALSGIREMEQNVDSLLVINNNNLLSLASKNLKQKEAWLMVDNVLYNAAKGIAEIITVDGYVNVDFKDVETIMKDSGTALMGMATARGEERALVAVEAALNSPLLENVNVQGATGLLLNICASEDTLTMAETTQIADYVKNSVGGQARIIIGQVFDDSLGDELSVTVIVTGFRKTTTQQAATTQRPATTAPAQSGLTRTGHGFTGLGQNQPIAPTQQPAPRIPQQPADHDRMPTSTLFEADEEPRSAPARQLTKEDRLNRVNSIDYDYQKPDALKRLEDVPAYVRRQLRLEHEPTKRKQPLSRMSLETTQDGGLQIREHNTFLFDQPD